MRNYVDNCAMKLYKRFMKGHSQFKGIPELHEELKTRVNLALTPTGIKGVDSLTCELKLSRFKLVEWIGWGLIPIGNLPSVPLGDRCGTAQPSGYLPADARAMLPRRAASR